MIRYERVLKYRGEMITEVFLSLIKSYKVYRPPHLQTCLQELDYEINKK
jgi:hypothetical protein